MANKESNPTPSGVPPEAIWAAFDRYVLDKSELEWFRTLDPVKAIEFALISREKKAWAARSALARLEERRHPSGLTNLMVARHYVSNALAYAEGGEDGDLKAVIANLNLIATLLESPDAPNRDHNGDDFK